MIKLEDGVPAPKRVSIGWPHGEMEVGQSFLVTDRTLMAVCNANWRYGKKLNMKFTAKKVEGGIRVWRIA